MTLEIFAVIIAVLLLVKLAVIAINPRAWIKVPEFIYGGGNVSTIIFLVLTAIVGYYLLQELTIVQIFAVTLFVTLLMGLGFIPYQEKLLKLSKYFLKEKHPFRKHWLSILIWIGLSIWVLWAVFF